MNENVQHPVEAIAPRAGVVGRVSFIGKSDGSSRRAGGFTLVEILIVVVLLSILAMVVVPQVSDASTRARSSVLADDLRTIRNQISIFKAQHKDRPPGYLHGNGIMIEAVFIAQMTQSSDENTETRPPGTSGYPFGPYLREIPANPINSKRTVEMIPDGTPFPVAADDSHGWIYQPETTTFKSDAVGIDSEGKSYFEY